MNNDELVLIHPVEVEQFLIETLYEQDMSDHTVAFEEIEILLDALRATYQNTYYKYLFPFVDEKLDLGKEEFDIMAQAYRIGENELLSIENCINLDITELSINAFLVEFFSHFPLVKELQYKVAQEMYIFVEDKRLTNLLK